MKLQNLLPSGNQDGGQQQQQQQQGLLAPVQQNQPILIDNMLPISRLALLAMRNQNGYR